MSMEHWQEEFENKFAVVFADYAVWKKSAQDPTDVLNFIRSLIHQARAEERGKTAFEAHKVLHDHFMNLQTPEFLDVLEAAQNEILKLGVAPPTQP